MNPELQSGATNPSSSSSSTEAGAKVELRLDQTVEYQDLKLRWLELADSRCPIGVNCIWEGEILVTVEVRRDGEEPIEVELVLRAGIEPKTERAFGHELVLLGVDPYPKEGRTPERGDYVARLEVTVP